MKKTKTLVVILLSLLLVASMLGVVACDKSCKDGHTDADHNGVCDICKKEGLAVTHDWSNNDGICKVCSLKCAHESKNAECVCSVCGLTVHTWTYAQGVATCSACQATCSEHDFEEGYCTVCNYTCENHIWDATTGACSVCEAPCAHTFAETEGEFTCSICGYVCPHAAWAVEKADKAAHCKLCGKECIEHEWSAEDEACEICGTPCEHFDDASLFNDTGLCSVCAYQCTHDVWTSGECDKCEMICAHASYAYGICKVCSINMGQTGKDNCSHDYAHGLCKICGSKDPSSASNKTYNLASSSLPTMWNVLNYQSNDANTVLGYTEDSFFTFDYNEDMTGYQMVPAMATDFPVEVAITDELAAKYGFEKDEDGNYPSSRIWKITLRNDLTFDNGDPIKAVDFVETAMRLLDPDAANYRADSLYSGNMVIHNAENYVKQGTTVGKAASESFDGIREAYQAGKIALDMDVLDALFVNEWFGGTYAQVKGAGYFAGYFTIYAGEGDDRAPTNEDFFTKWIEPIVNSLGKDETLKEITWTAEQFEQMFADYSNCDDWNPDANAELADILSVPHTYGTINWSEVGLYAEDDYTLVFVLDKPLSGFYLHYSMSLPLVHVETYDRYESTEGGVYSNKYGTSADTYVGYGPYKLVNYVQDSIIQFVKNGSWYGHDASNSYTDDTTLYEATSIVIKQVVDEATRLQMFLKGEIDSYGLQEADMEDYQSSKYTYYTEGDSTWFIALNPDFDALEKTQADAKPVNTDYVVNKTVLTIKEFRQALSFALNRAEYQLTLDPVGSVAKALYGGMIISDPENGITYRSTEEAKDTILAFWGLTNDVCPAGCTCAGTEHLYESKDDAIASISGYDMAGAKTLFKNAYDIAVANGLIPASAIESGKWEVQIMIGQPGTGSSTYYNKGYEYLSKVWTEAVKGTEFEGHLTFRQSQPLGSTDFSDYLKNNSIDMLFGVGWTGSSLDPYSLIEAYVSSKYQYDPAWDTTKTNLVIELPLTDGAYATDGTLTKLSGSVFSWYEALVGNEREFVVLDAQGEATDTKVKINAGTSANANLRLVILSNIERVILEQYNMIPVGLEASASMLSEKLKFETEDYIFGVGRGGLKYLDFKYTDEQWAEMVASQPDGVWNYKVSESVE